MSKKDTRYTEPVTSAVADDDYDPDDELQEKFVKAVELAILKKKIKGVPVAKYDAVNKRAYIEYSDGRVEYV